MAKIDRQAHAQMLADHDAQFAGVVAGIDEVGRGPLAGNVVTACVVMPKETILPWIDDSKKLSEARREKVFQEIMDIALYVGIGQSTPEEIDRINILQATYLAMERALAQLNIKPDIALIDGNRAKDFGLPVKTVVHGDSLSASIAAASVLAKVTRDDLMLAMAEEYPQYGFEIHKGYGTKAHYEALTAHGPSPIHRMTFLKKFYGEK